MTAANAICQISNEITFNSTTVCIIFQHAKHSISHTHGRTMCWFFLGNIKLYFISYVISWLWWVQLFELIHESENSIFIKFMKRLCMVWFGLKYAYELPNRGASKRYLRNSSISIIFIIIQIRRSHDRLIFIMGIPIPVNMVFVLRRDLGHLGLITHLKYKTAGFAGQL